MDSCIANSGAEKDGANFTISGGAASRVSGGSSIVRSANWTGENVMKKTSNPIKSVIKNIDATSASSSNEKLERTKGRHIEIKLPSGQYKLSRKYGVRTFNGDGKKTSVCSYIAYKANLENDRTERVNVLVEFTDHQGRAKVASVPREDFANIKRLMDRLLSLGFCVHEPELAKSFLYEHFKVNPPSVNIRMVNEPGWHTADSGDMKLYVTNGKTFTPDGSSSNVALNETVNAGFACKGSNEEWQNRIAAVCVGNSRLSLMVGASLLGPMLELIGCQNVGLHIFGESKSAKTTCLTIARSIYGDQYYGFSWNSTTGALQETASSRNHSTLCLDEISQCEESHVSAAAYALMNGVNKSRLTPDCKLSAPARVRLAVISTGEFSFQEHLSQAGIKVKPGQLVRLPSIPIHPTKGMFPNLHGEATIGALASRLHAAVEENYGTIGQAWIKHLVDNQQTLKSELPVRVKEIQAELLAAINSDEPTEAQREVAKSMAAIACAGEEAVSCGLLPWPKRTATKSAITCFKAWYRHDMGEAVEREPFPVIKKFFKANYASFEPLEKFKKLGDTCVYTHQVKGVDVILVPLKMSSKTIFLKSAEKEVLRALDKRDLLLRGFNSRPTRQIMIPKSELPKQSFYVIRRSILETK